MRNSPAMNGERQGAGKHVPVRTCVVCREKASKRTLIRVVRTENGIQVDASGKLNGRGAYLCDRASCWERAVTTDILNKALRASLTAEDRQRLQQAIPQP
ncbi:MAG: YlxR family protein [Anaerolineae bacterium]|nr:YlxR family protein [Anaerolineae bacterium]